MSIPKFYEGQEILITGGSGFIGKALIEKLLRSCPGVAKVYLLLRPKRDTSVDDRLNALLNNAIFQRIRAECPEALKKVIAVAGDCSELQLGLSAADREKLRNVNIIFHSAASVRFDDALTRALFLNTRGTHELIKLAETMPNLKVFVHVSTTYCNPQRNYVEEKVYPALGDWRKAIQLAETYDEETLSIYNLKYSDFQPNTYTFTKSLAEQVVEEYRHKVPLIIFRPAIVVNTVCDPIIGWADNFNGPIGLLVGSGSGIVRTTAGDKELVCDYVPVDVVIRSMLVAGYKRGMETKVKCEKSVDVYNCAIGDIAPLTIGELERISRAKIRISPFEKAIWCSGYATKCLYWHIIKFMLMHIPMALIVDTTLRLTNRKPFLLKLQRRIFTANLAVYHFMITKYEFQTDNFHSLENLISDSDKFDFGFMDMALLDYETYLHNCIRGCKVYLLNEQWEASRGGLIRFRILEALNFLLQVVCWWFVARWVYLYSVKGWLVA